MSVYFQSIEIYFLKSPIISPKIISSTRGTISYIDHISIWKTWILIAFTQRVYSLSDFVISCLAIPGQEVTSLWATLQTVALSSVSSTDVEWFMQNSKQQWWRRQNKTKNNNNNNNSQRGNGQDNWLTVCILIKVETTYGVHTRLRTESA